MISLYMIIDAIPRYLIRSFLALIASVIIVLPNFTGCNKTEPNVPEYDTVRVVTWNAKDLLSLDSIPHRSNDFRRFAEDIRPDIILIQEITSKEIVEAIKDEMGLYDYEVACSDFVRSDGAYRGAFEVAVISRYPLSEITEYDPSPDGGDYIEKEIVPLSQYGIEEVVTARGFLMAKIHDLNLYVGVTHLKSSLGQVGLPDSSNALKRELVAAYMAKTISDLSAQEPETRFILGGDFNVGHSDHLKNGTDLFIDCYDPDECPGEDLYDETHALLGGGLIDGLQMTNQTLSITETTYIDYPGSPIDNIYVLWSGEGEVGPAVRVNETFGSDHVPVNVSILVSIQ